MSDDDLGRVSSPMVRSADPSVEPINDDRTGVEGAVGNVTQAASGGDGDTAVAAAPQCTRGPNRQAPKRLFRPQSCRMCTNPHVFETSSGLNDHAAMHHGMYYSARWDHFRRRLELVRSIDTTLSALHLRGP